VKSAEANKRLMFLSPQTSFGLSDQYIKSVYEIFFFMKYYGGWSFSESYNLPIKIRTWFVERLQKQMEKEEEAARKASQKRKK
jgi:hypothetical protein